MAHLNSETAQLHRMVSETAHLSSTASDMANLSSTASDMANLSRETAHLHRMISDMAHLHRMSRETEHLFSDMAHLSRMANEMARLHRMVSETTLPSSLREACGDCCQQQLLCFTRIAGFTSVIHREEEEMHFQEMHTDRPPMAYGGHASIHGFDAITMISSIRVALLPFQSLYHPQEIHRIATPTNALQTPAPIPIESTMNTGRYTRIHTRQHSDPLFPPHPSRNAFAIAFTHSSIYTQQDSIHRFAASCDGNNLHSTPLHPTFNFIHGYYTLHTHQGCLESHVRSASPTERFNTTSLHPHHHLFISTTLQPFTFIHLSLLNHFLGLGWG